jgi:hypothetical protein
MTEPEVMDTSTIKIETPDGTMFVAISEYDHGHPCRVEIHIGKAGSQLLAWANGLSTTCTLALQHGVPMSEIMCHLLGVSSGRQATKYLNRVDVKSGPDGVAKAMMTYLMSRR